MRNLKRDRCAADLVLSASESKFALNDWPLQCCHYSQRLDEASQQQLGYIVPMGELGSPCDPGK
jgi:hypothetical protein